MCRLVGILVVVLSVTHLAAMFDTKKSWGKEPFCTQSQDCSCGNQCVTLDDTLCTAQADFCLCRRGCAVFDKFISAGARNVPVYGNVCNCPSDPLPRHITPTCTRVMWWNEPENFPEYPINPRCITQSPDV